MTTIAEEEEHQVEQANSSFPANGHAAQTQGGLPMDAGSERLDEAAIDRNVGPRDICGSLAGKEDDQVCYLLGSGKTSRGRIGSGLARHVIGVDTRSARHGVGNPVVTEPEVGRNRPGADGVHTDVVSCHFLGERLAKVGQGCFGGAVVQDRRVGEKGVHRTRGNNVAATGADHRRQDCPGHPHGRHKIQSDRVGPVLIGDAQKSTGASLSRAHIVDENIDPTVFKRHCGQIDGTRGPRQIDWDQLDNTAPHKDVELSRALPSSGDDVHALIGKARVTANPMPVLAPVTTATLPSSPSLMAVRVNLFETDGSLIW